MRIECCDQATKRYVATYDSHKAAAEAIGARRQSISLAVQYARPYRGMIWRKETGIARLPEFLSERCSTVNGKPITLKELNYWFARWLPRSLPEMRPCILFDNIECRMRTNDILEAVAEGYYWKTTSDE